MTDGMITIVKICRSFDTPREHPKTSILYVQTNSYMKQINYYNHLCRVWSYLKEIQFKGDMFIRSGTCTSGTNISE